MPLDKDQPNTLIEQFIIGAMSFKPEELGMGVYTLFSDDELRQIDIPTLLLIGDHERVINPYRVLERARRLMPQIQTGMIRNAGHLMPVDQAGATNARMLEFLLES